MAAIRELLVEDSAVDQFAAAGFRVAAGSDRSADAAAADRPKYLTALPGLSTSRDLPRPRA